jgi:cytidine deaminase
MVQKELTVRYTIHEMKEGLSGEDRTLLDHAESASQVAYAPYSNFKVGVAIRTSTDHIIEGSNQENGAFPIGQCAERVALYNLFHQHGRESIDTIAIVVDSVTQTSPASPCGSCRQILNEYRSNQPTPIRLLLGLKGSEIVFEMSDVTDLLPLAFDGSFLGS